MTVRHITTALLILFLIVLPPAASIERVELEGNIDSITTTDTPGHFIISLINKNDFNVTSVENIWINFTFDIDPTSIRAVNNYNESITPAEVRQRSILFTYNSTLPALGYGKIFLDINKYTPPPPKTTKAADETSEYLTQPTSPTPPNPEILQDIEPIETEQPPISSPTATMKEKDTNHVLIGLATLFLLALVAVLVVLIR